MDVQRLSEAFQSFTIASRSLESHYELLRDKVKYLTAELEKKNNQLQEALADAQHNREYLKAILHNLEEAIVVVNPDDEITLINRSAECLLGLDPSAVVGKALNDLGLPSAGSGRETVLAVEDKRYDVIISKSRFVQDDGRVGGSVILIKDITRLKELEALHERNQRLIDMGEMSAKIVHEIRNPLCSIELFAGMLERDVTEPSQKDLARGISKGINNLNTILTNMLFFARPNTPVMKTINLQKILEEALSMFGLLLESRNVSLEKSMSDVEIEADPQLLKQVFTNIIVNAVQSMPGGGCLSVTIEGEEDSVAVNFEDSGEGIRESEIEKIFNPFFSTKETGTGLGLAIASMIMQRHGGYIKAKSEEGKGSVFSLYFPCARDAGEQAGKPSQEDE